MQSEPTRPFFIRIDVKSIDRINFHFFIFND
jgi:hypothetical protein